MERSYLIQRLQQPIGKVNPFSFGSGGSGMGKDNMEVLAQIWSFDYMGAAEFEYGAVPTALNKMIAEETTLVASAFDVPYSYDFHGFTKDHPAKLYEGKKKVYYLCNTEHENDVKTLIALWAKGTVGNTKESILFDMSLADLPKDINREIVGWWELDNGFMFFTDEKMWRGICDALDVKVPSKKQVSKKK